MKMVVKITFAIYTSLKKNFNFIIKDDNADKVKILTYDNRIKILMLFKS